MPASPPYVTRRRLLAASLAGTAALAARPAFAQPASPVATPGVPDRDAGDWVGTWADCPQLPFDLELTPHTDRTYRHVVRISLGSDRVRVRLTNAHATSSQVVEAATVAVATGEGRVDPGTIHPLTFGGQASLMLAPDAVVVSDPVALVCGDRSDLAVSLYIPGDVIVDPEGLLTTYVSEPGDHTSEADLPINVTARSTAMLAAIDVSGGAPGGAIVALGGSSTEGTGSTPGANRRWTDVLSERLFSEAGLRMGMVNAGINGNRVLRDGVGEYRYRSGISALARFDRDVLSHPGTSHLVVWMGGNDIVAPLFAEDPAMEAVTAEDVAGGLRTLADRARTHGLTVVGGTIPPAGGSPFDDPAADAMRVAVNDWIRSGGAFDGVIDFDAMVRDPEQPGRLLPAYDSGDHIHANDVGYQAIGNAIDLDLFRPVGRERPES